MLYQGDCLEILPMLEANSIQCVVTSPPYWGLRDYGCAGQLGLEKTPEEYVANLVRVFQEVKRVLRDDGTLWLNLGDSYNGSQKGSGGTGIMSAKQNSNKGANYAVGGQPLKMNIEGLKPKDLIGIPWRVAFALQADGWWLRQDIIWAKPNPMPESVTDRCTKSHEYIFLLTKSARYFYDAEAIKEPQADCTTERYKSGWNGVDDDGSNGARTGSAYKKMKAGMTMGEAMGGNGMRNKRSVWTITTKPFKGAHFATFPPEIPEICIKAGTSEKGCCPECGSPWERVIEKKKIPRDELPKDDPRYRPNRYHDNKYANEIRNGYECGMYSESITIGWRPTCTHNLDPIPCTVLDPFAGAGTTGMIAEKLDRKFIGIELNPEYAKMGERRIEAAELPLFTNLSTVGQCEDIC
jgi:DNA modification methylase